MSHNVSGGKSSSRNGKRHSKKNKYAAANLQSRYNSKCGPVTVSYVDKTVPYVEENDDKQK
jgi:hypothetical protein